LIFFFQVDNLVKHIALGHSKLDEFLLDEELVARKRQQILSKPRRVMVPMQCPVCFLENPTREHLVRHFMEDLLEIVENDISDELNCDRCEFRYRLS
jgi:hypothetical protein